MNPDEPRAPQSDLLNDVLERLAGIDGTELSALEQSRLARAVDRLAGAGDSPAASRDAPQEPTRTRARADAASEPVEAKASPTEQLLERLDAQRAPDGRFQVLSELGRGGMGVVYQVFEPTLQRKLAMKVAHSELAEDARRDQRVARFLEEAQITGQLDHPGIVPLHELGLDAAGRAYFTMRMVRGEDLAAIFQHARANEGGWSVARVLDVLLRVCESMAYAHSRRVVHRDLKPSNVMVGRFGEVYVMDWGLARVLGREDTHDLRPSQSSSASVLHSVRRDGVAGDANSPLVTMDGTVLGTPAYMSPEQARGELERIDGRTDVYAIGAMLYQLLAGSAPYQDGSAAADGRSVWMRILGGPPTPLAQLAPNASTELLAICERAMARELSARYSTVDELAEDLRAFRDGRVVHAYEAGALAELRKWMLRDKALASALIGVLLVTVTGLGYSRFVEARERAHAEAAQESAERTRRAAEEVLRFMDGLGRQGPSERRADDPWTFREALQSSTPALRARLHDDPDVGVYLAAAVGRLLSRQGDAEAGLALIREAVEVGDRRLGAADIITCEARKRAMAAYMEEGRLDDLVREAQLLLAAREPLAGRRDDYVLHARAQLLTGLRAAPGRDQAAAAHAADLRAAIAESASRGELNALQAGAIAALSGHYQSQGDCEALRACVEFYDERVARVRPESARRRLRIALQLIDCLERARATADARTCTDAALALARAALPDDDELTRELQRRREQLDSRTDE